jgi:hypothetical protein
MLSPFVEATASGVCTVQFMQPCSRDRWSSKNPDALTEKLGCIIDLLVRCDLIARAGLAENPDASFLAAHRAKPVTHVTETKAFLAPLPIETLLTEANFNQPE